VDPAAVEALVVLLDEAYRRKSWHGTNLRGSVRGLTAVEASVRAGAARHSIADITVHCAYWKYCVRRRLRGEKRGAFPLRGSNWFRLPEPLAEQSWQDCVALLDAQHRLLVEAVAELRPADLVAARSGSKLTNGFLVRGVALHDVYHAGQIQLLKGIGRAR
jgi:uncharacterized damage-inducible protein DinB